MYRSVGFPGKPQLVLEIAKADHYKVSYIGGACLIKHLILIYRYYYEAGQDNRISLLTICQVLCDNSIHLPSYLVVKTTAWERLVSHFYRYGNLRLRGVSDFLKVFKKKKSPGLPKPMLCYFCSDKPTITLSRGL